MSNDAMKQIERAAAALREEGAREVYVFGSTARGEVGPRSDVDLAVTGLPPSRFFKAFGRAQDLLDGVLDLVDLDEESPFTRYLRQAGELRRVA